MLRLVKWAYDLGIRHERVRIAAHLQAHAQGARVQHSVMDDMFREEMSRPKPNKKRLERLEFDRAVARQVDELIQDIFHPKGEWQPVASIMFPEGEDQK